MEHVMSKSHTDKKIENTVENWEKGVLGNDEEFVKIAEDVTSADVDAMLELQMISIRLQKGMINDLKSIAKLHGLGGYQPLIRRVLDRFVIAEMKTIARNSIAEKDEGSAQESKEVIYDELKIEMCG
ncbi:MAG: putative DNA binding CopG/RHH family protein [Psychroserpens sp.]|jgi:predicted DNA binding CopG/RHH family protein